MRRRFSTEAGGVLSRVSALSPKHASFLDKKCLQPMAKFYGVTEENLTPELHQVKRLLERKKQQTNSCLRRIKNYLRNSSGDARNSNLGLLAINKQRSKALDVQRVIDIFTSNHNNRRIVLL
ncbi:hypothetical protein KUCAC02_018322 [Chaenocephalus aceratus]|uniref:Uncharacterized protein n=1 Tax=Chaenocephalus aceratus TaxID=36190 RepID=A0ACB9W875_CHAAC|nr:hypothetical protein KUCAC02_018322 [Chaenocephalus aceratus]